MKCHMFQPLTESDGGEADPRRSGMQVTDIYNGPNKNIHKPKKTANNGLTAKNSRLEDALPASFLRTLTTDLKNSRSYSKS